MKFRDTPLAGLTIIETAPLSDERGAFERIFCNREFSTLRTDIRWSQINRSRTVGQGLVRGMHFQYPPAAEAKLIRCLRGRVFDVAVDVRAGSPTFLRWHAVELSEDQPIQIFIPQGFAHGFQTLTPEAELLYLHTAAWSREHEGRLRYDDPMLAIAWPQLVTKISDQDRAAPLLGADFAGVRL